MGQSKSRNRPHSLVIFDQIAKAVRLGMTRVFILRRSHKILFIFLTHKKNSVWNSKSIKQHLSYAVMRPPQNPIPDVQSPYTQAAVTNLLLLSRAILCVSEKTRIIVPRCKWWHTTHDHMCCHASVSAVFPRKPLPLPVTAFSHCTNAPPVCAADTTLMAHPPVPKSCAATKLHSKVNFRELLSGGRKPTNNHMK